MIMEILLYAILYKGDVGMRFKEFLNEADILKYPQTDEEILRASMYEELRAVNLYQQLARQAKDPRVRKVLLDIAHEEKVHIGEFEELLEKVDPAYDKAEDEAEEELEDMGIY